jgi:hypothetical protein
VILYERLAQEVRELKEQWSDLGAAGLKPRVVLEARHPAVLGHRDRADATPPQAPTLHV